MKLRLTSLILMLAFATPALAQGAIGTVDRGRYRCELPGDAAGVTGVAQPDLNFTIISASRYKTPEGGGTYLRRGDTMTFTSGPRKGERYSIVSPHFMRRMDGELPGRLRCVRGSVNYDAANI